jgi:hypothetical protein
MRGKAGPRVAPAGVLHVATERGEGLRAQHIAISRTRTPERPCGRVKAGVHCRPRWVSSLTHHTPISVNAL